MMRDSRRRSPESSKRQRRRERRDSRENKSDSRSLPYQEESNMTPTNEYSYNRPPPQSSQQQQQMMPSSSTRQPDDPSGSARFYTQPDQYQQYPPPQQYPPQQPPPQQYQQQPYNQPYEMRPPRRRSSAHSSSSSTSSSLLDISRRYPEKQRVGGVLTRFFAAPSDRRRRRRRSGTKKRRVLYFGNSSSSSVNSDMAYGTGYIPRPKSRNFSPQTGGRTYGEPGTGRRDRDRESKDARDPNKSSTPRRSKTDEEILSIGRQLSDLAKQQNEDDLRRIGKTRPSTLAAAANKYSEYRKTKYGSGNRGIGSSKPTDASSDDEDWESASDSGDDSSSDGADSNMAYGSVVGHMMGSAATTAAAGLAGGALGSAASGAFPKPAAEARPGPGLMPRKSSLVDPTLFGPYNSLRGYITSPDVHNDPKGKQPQRSASESISQVPMKVLQPMPMSDADKYGVVELPQRSRPAPVPLQQPIPVAPVSSKVYDADKYEDSSSRRDAKRTSRKSDEKGWGEAAVAGVAAVAVGAAVASEMKGKRREERDDERRDRERRAEKSDRRDDEKRDRERRPEKSEKRDKDYERDRERRKSKRDSYPASTSAKDEEKHKRTAREEGFDDSPRKKRERYADGGQSSVSYNRGGEEIRVDYDDASRSDLHRSSKRDRRPRSDEHSSETRKGDREVTRQDQPVTGIDPFQFQVASDAFATPQFETPKRPLTPMVVTVDREPIFDDSPPVSPAPEGRLSRKDSFEIEQMADEQHQRDREGSGFSDAVKHATVPVAAAAVAAAMAAEHTKSKERRKRESGDKRQQESKDSVQEEADKYYRESRRAKKIAGEQARSRSASPEGQIVTPPAMKNMPPVKSPYDGPDADVRIDNKIFPHESKRFSFRASELNTPAWVSRDPSAERERPLLNLVWPTPAHSREPTPALEQKGQPSNKGDGSRETVDESADTAEAAGAKSVSWGKNETKSFEPESPERAKSETSDKPRARLNKTSQWGILAAAIAGNSREPANEPDAGSSDRSREEYSSSGGEPPVPGPKPASPKPDQMPGAFADDVEFAGALAAGLKDTGFDPNIVIDDPTYARRDSPPGSNELTENGAHRSFADTVSTALAHETGHWNPETGHFIDAPEPTRSEVSGASAPEWPTNLSKSQKKKLAKKLAGEATESAGVMGQTSRDAVFADTRAPANGPPVEDSAADLPPIKLSKKEQKKRDKEAKAKALADADDWAAASEAQAEPVQAEGAAQDEWEPSSSKKSKKKDKKKRDSQVIETPKEGSSTEARNDWLPSQDSRTTEEWTEAEVTQPGDSWESARDMPDEGTTSRDVKADDEWAEAPKKGKKNKKSKRDSQMFESPTQSNAPSEAGDLAKSQDAQPEEQWEAADKKSKKKKRNSKRDSQIYDSPSQSTAPSEYGDAEQTRDAQPDVEWDTSGKKSKRKSKRDSQTFDSPIQSPEPGNVEQGQDAQPDDEGEGPDKKDKKKKTNASRDSQTFDSPPPSVAASEVTGGSSKRNSKSKRRSGTADDYDDYGDGPPDRGRDNFEDRDVTSVVSEGRQSDKRRSKGSRQPEQYDDDTKSIASAPGGPNRGGKEADKKSSGIFSGLFGKSNASKDNVKKESFLDNADTFGAGVGLASVAVAAAALSRSNAPDSSSDFEQPSLKQKQDPRPREIDAIDPEIVERQIKPAIDPQFGDLLPLPPSEPGSPVEAPEELPDLPESRPDTPPEERALKREMFTHRRRRSTQETPAKSPSQTAIPIALRLGGGRSVPTTPSSLKSPPSSSTAAFPELSPGSKKSLRPTSWDHSREIRPLYLLEQSRQETHDTPTRQAELSLLPPSDPPSSSGTSPTSFFTPDRSAQPSPGARGDLSLALDIPRASDVAGSQDTTPRAEVKPELPNQSYFDVQPGTVTVTPPKRQDPEPVESTSKDRSSYLLNSDPSSLKSNRSTKSAGGDSVRSPYLTPTKQRSLDLSLPEITEDMISADEHFSDAVEGLTEDEYLDWQDANSTLSFNTNNSADKQLTPRVLPVQSPEPPQQESLEGSPGAEPSDKTASADVKAPVSDPASVSVAGLSAAEKKKLKKAKMKGLRLDNAPSEDLGESVDSLPPAEEAKNVPTQNTAEGKVKPEADFTLAKKSKKGKKGKKKSFSAWDDTPETETVSASQDDRGDQAMGAASNADESEASNVAGESSNTDNASAEEKPAVMDDWDQDLEADRKARESAAAAAAAAARVGTDSTKDDGYDESSTETTAEKGKVAMPWDEDAAPEAEYEQDYSHHGGSRYDYDNDDNYYNDPASQQYYYENQPDEHHDDYARAPADDDSGSLKEVDSWDDIAKMTTKRAEQERDLANDPTDPWNRPEESPADVAGADSADKVLESMDVASPQTVVNAPKELAEGPPSAPSGPSVEDTAETDDFTPARALSKKEKKKRKKQQSLQLQDTPADDQPAWTDGAADSSWEASRGDALGPSSSTEEAIPRPADALYTHEPASLEPETDSLSAEGEEEFATVTSSKKKKKKGKRASQSETDESGSKPREESSETALSQSNTPEARSGGTDDDLRADISTSKDLSAESTRETAVHDLPWDDQMEDIVDEGNTESQRSAIQSEASEPVFSQRDGPSLISQATSLTDEPVQVATESAEGLGDLGSSEPGWTEASSNKKGKKTKKNRVSFAETLEETAREDLTAEPAEPAEPDSSLGEMAADPSQDPDTALAPSDTQDAAPEDEWGLASGKKSKRAKKRARAAALQRLDDDEENDTAAKADVTAESEPEETKIEGQESAAPVEDAGDEAWATQPTKKSKKNKKKREPLSWDDPEPSEGAETVTEPAATDKEVNVSDNTAEEPSSVLEAQLLPESEALTETAPEDDVTEAEAPPQVDVEAEFEVPKKGKKNKKNKKAKEDITSSIFEEPAEQPEEPQDDEPASAPSETPDTWEQDSPNLPADVVSSSKEIGPLTDEPEKRAGADSLRDAGDNMAHDAQQDVGDTETGAQQEEDLEAFFPVKLSKKDRKKKKKQEMLQQASTDDAEGEPFEQAAPLSSTNCISTEQPENVTADAADAHEPKAPEDQPQLEDDGWSGATSKKSKKNKKKKSKSISLEAESATEVSPETDTNAEAGEQTSPTQDESEAGSLGQEAAEMAETGQDACPVGFTPEDRGAVDVEASGPSAVISQPRLAGPPLSKKEKKLRKKSKSLGTGLWEAPEAAEATEETGGDAEAAQPPAEVEDEWSTAPSNKSKKNKKDKSVDLQEQESPLESSEARVAPQDTPTAANTDVLDAWDEPEADVWDEPVAQGEPVVDDWDMDWKPDMSTAAKHDPSLDQADAAAGDESAQADDSAPAPDAPLESTPEDDDLWGQAVSKKDKKKKRKGKKAEEYDESASRDLAATESVLETTEHDAQAATGSSAAPDQQGLDDNSWAQPMSKKDKTKKKKAQAQALSLESETQESSSDAVPPPDLSATEATSTRLDVPLPEDEPALDDSDHKEAGAPEDDEWATPKSKKDKKKKKKDQPLQPQTEPSIAEGVSLPEQDLPAREDPVLSSERDLVPEASDHVTATTEVVRDAEDRVSASALDEDVEMVDAQDMTEPTGNTDARPGLKTEEPKDSEAADVTDEWTTKTTGKKGKKNKKNRKSQVEADPGDDTVPEAVPEATPLGQEMEAALQSEPPRNLSGDDAMEDVQTTDTVEPEAVVGSWDQPETEAVPTNQPVVGSTDQTGSSTPDYPLERKLSKKEKKKQKKKMASSWADEEVDQPDQPPEQSAGPSLGPESLPVELESSKADQDAIPEGDTNAPASDPQPALEAEEEWSASKKSKDKKKQKKLAALISTFEPTEDTTDSSRAPEGEESTQAKLERQGGSPTYESWAEASEREAAGRPEPQKVSDSWEHIAEDNDRELPEDPAAEAASAPADDSFAVVTGSKKKKGKKGKRSQVSLDWSDSPDPVSPVQQAVTEDQPHKELLPDDTIQESSDPYMAPSEEPPTQEIDDATAEANEWAPPKKRKGKKGKSMSVDSEPALPTENPTNVAASNTDPEGGTASTRAPVEAEPLTAGPSWADTQSSTLLETGESEWATATSTKKKGKKGKQARSTGLDEFEERFGGQPAASKDTTPDSADFDSRQQADVDVGMEQAPKSDWPGAVPRKEASRDDGGVQDADVPDKDRGEERPTPSRKKTEKDKKRQSQPEPDAVDDTFEARLANVENEPRLTEGPAVQYTSIPEEMPRESVEDEDLGGFSIASSKKKKKKKGSRVLDLDYTTPVTEEATPEQKFAKKDMPLHEEQGTKAEVLSSEPEVYSARDLPSGDLKQHDKELRTPRIGQDNKKLVDSEGFGALEAGAAATAVAGGVAALASAGSKKKTKGKKKKVLDKRTEQEEDMFDDPALWESADKKSLYEDAGPQGAGGDGFWESPEAPEKRGEEEEGQARTKGHLSLLASESVTESEGGWKETAKQGVPLDDEFIESPVLGRGDSGRGAGLLRRETGFEEPTGGLLREARSIGDVGSDLSDLRRSPPRPLPAVQEEDEMGGESRPSSWQTSGQNRDSGYIAGSPLVGSRRGRTLHEDQEGVRDSGVHSGEWSGAQTPQPSADRRRPVLQKPESPAMATPEPEKINVRKRSSYGSLKQAADGTPTTGSMSRRAVSSGHEAATAAATAGATVAATTAATATATGVTDGRRSVSDQPMTVRRSASNSSLSRRRTPEPLKIRPEGSGTNNPATRSTPTPPLRRVDKRMSGDLRALRQQETPVANEGRVRSKDMTDVYDGFGEGRIGSPRSPTRPHSMRRRQSTQVLELESRVQQLLDENQRLTDARANVETTLSSGHRATQMLSDRDAEIEALKQSLQFLQNEVNRLTEVNEGLSSANAELASTHNGRYADLEVRHGDVSRDLDQTRGIHDNVDSALQAKDTEIAQLRAELESTKEQIRDMQRQMLASKSGDVDFLEIHDEDHFEQRCEELCHHVQQWVLRFSKFSDMRACRLTSEINDEKTIDRLDNTILDGSDVDAYLNDRVKRRDVFMSMTMNMVWEFVFTRYLFGMDREQRQKLKSLEKLLTEVGPPQAVRQWRAVTLTLLSRRDSFHRQRDTDTEAVVQAIFQTLSKILPPPSNLEGQIQTQLRRVMREAVELSIKMRTQRAEYMMLPPLQPEYDGEGELKATVPFNASMMNERSGSASFTNEDLEAQGAVLRIVLFPLVVKKGDDDGVGDEEIVVSPAQVLIRRSKRHFTPSSDAGGASLAAQSRISLAPSGMGTEF